MDLCDRRRRRTFLDRRQTGHAPASVATSLGFSHLHNYENFHRDFPRLRLDRETVVTVESLPLEIFVGGKRRVEPRGFLVQRVVASGTCMLRPAHPDHSYTRTVSLDLTILFLTNRMRFGTVPIPSVVMPFQLSSSLLSTIASILTLTIQLVTLFESERARSRGLTRISLGACRHRN